MSCPRTLLTPSLVVTWMREYLFCTSWLRIDLLMPFMIHNFTMSEGYLSFSIECFMVKISTSKDFANLKQPFRLAVFFPIGFGMFCYIRFIILMWLFLFDLFLSFSSEVPFKFLIAPLMPKLIFTDLPASCDLLNVNLLKHHSYLLDLTFFFNVKDFP